MKSTTICPLFILLLVLNLFSMQTTFAQETVTELSENLTEGLKILTNEQLINQSQYQDIVSESFIKNTLVKLNQKFESAYGWNFFSINAKNTNIENLLNEKSLSKIIRDYYLIIGGIIVFIIIIMDLYLFSKVNIEEENEETAKLKPATLFIKYIILISIATAPSIYTKSMVFVYQLVKLPMDILAQNNSNDVKNEISYIKTYDLYSEKLYDLELEELGDYDTERLTKYIELKIEKLKINVYYGGLNFLYTIQDIALFVIKTLASLIVYILSILFPMAILLSFIPGFQGGIQILLKQIVAFSLYSVIGIIIIKISENIIEKSSKMEILAIIDYQTAKINVDQASKVTTLISDNMEPSNYFVAIISIVLFIIIPKIADMLIAGSQSGAFFSAVGAITTAAITGTLKYTGINATGRASKKMIQTGVSKMLGKGGQSKGDYK